MADANQTQPADQGEKQHARRAVKRALHVKAPMVTVKTENARIVYLYKGDVVPDGVDADSIKHLQSLGFVTEDNVSPID